MKLLLVLLAHFRSKYLPSFLTKSFRGVSIVNLTRKIKGCTYIFFFDCDIFSLLEATYGNRCLRCTKIPNTVIFE